jgi:hypothetical protein
MSISISVSAQRESEAEIKALALLLESQFDSRLINWLSQPMRYAVAARRFAMAADPKRPDAQLASIFVERTTPDVLRYRLASRFGLVSEQAREGHKVEPVTIDRLRRDRRKGARIVLAAIGELPWKEMNRSERAVFALARLVSERIGRAAS